MIKERCIYRSMKHSPKSLKLSHILTLSKVPASAPRIKTCKTVQNFYTMVSIWARFVCCSNDPSDTSNTTLPCNNFLPLEDYYACEQERIRSEKNEQQQRVYKKVIGADTRVQIPEKDAQQFPWSAIGQLSSAACPGSQQTYTCTATVIAPNVAITAAHCVTRKSGNCGKLVFSPGLRVTAPFGSHLVVRVEVLNCWSKGDLSCDFALLFLNERVGCSTGVFSFDGNCGEEMLSRVYVAGYPIDKFFGITMYFSSCRQVYLPWCAGQGSFNHQCDTQKGMSGGPIWTWKSGKRYLKGIHRSARKSDWNTATRITKQVATWINTLIKDIEPCS